MNYNKYNCYLLDHPYIYGVGFESLKTIKDVTLLHLEKACSECDETEYYEIALFSTKCAEAIEQLRDAGCQLGDLSGDILVYFVPGPDGRLEPGFVFTARDPNHYKVWIASPYDWMYLGNSQDRVQDVPESTIQEKAVDKAADEKLAMMAETNEELVRIANEVVNEKSNRLARVAEADRKYADKMANEKRCEDIIANEKNAKDKCGSIRHSQLAW